jgi:tryptophan halogenase
MTHIVADVNHITRHDNGEINHLILSNGNTITADLYIDCTGFKSLLLEQTMGVQFKSFNNNLQNDRAIATVIPYLDIDRELENYTSCTAIDNGWVWNIPLWNRIGTGYVYSSKFATEAEAEEQFRRHLKSNRMVVADADRADAAVFKHIKIKHGVHERAWEKNVVGVGLSNGFIEPLESTGLMLTHECIMKLIHVLQMRNSQVTQYDIDLFNFAFNEQIWGFKEFIAQHYALSMRNDTEYWKYVSSSTTYSNSITNFEPSLITNSHDMSIRLHRSHSFTESMSGIVYIAAGMGYNPVTTSKISWLNKQYNEDPDMSNRIRSVWESHRNDVIEHVQTLPTHYEFLKNNVYKCIST